VPASRPDRRAEIVRVAYRLIAERGLEGLRFADVARQAGINNGTLLYYFESKDALIQAVGAYVVDQYSETGVSREVMARLNPLNQLRLEFLDAAQRLDTQLGVVYTELLARSQRDPAVAAMLRDIDASWRAWLSSILERGVKNGMFRADLDIQQVTTTIMSTVRGVGVQALVGQDGASMEPVMKAIGGLIEGWIVRKR
jgi:AcrR family transcriptional regulator